MVQIIISAILLGVGLAMDSSAVSMTNGFNEPRMKNPKMILVAFMFGFFQFFMPLIGYFAGYSVINLIQPFIPWIALFILVYLGGKMILDAYRESKSSKEENISNESDNTSKTTKQLTFKTLVMQAFATSIDALSVGLTISNYTIFNAILTTILIGVVTFTISIVSLVIGKKFGHKFSNKATVVGGIILIGIGLEIFITGLFL